VSDTGAKRYFFESSYSPSIFWVDVAKLKLAEGSAPARLDLSDHPILSGEVSDKFVGAEPFKFLSHSGRVVAVAGFEHGERRGRD
jgi:hypothetical protein